MSDTPDRFTPDHSPPEADPAISSPEHAASGSGGLPEDWVESPGVIAPSFIARIDEALEENDIVFLRNAVTELHPADAADLLEHLSPDAFWKALHLLDGDLPAEALTELSDESRRTALEALSEEGLAGIIETLDSDDASFILNDLDDERRSRILARVSASDRAAIESSLAFDEESAGRLMQRDFVAAPIFWSVGQTIDHMRSVDPDDLPDTFFEIYIVDPAFRLQGVVSVSRLLRSPREAALKDLMKDASVSIRPEMDQEEVAFLFQQYNLASAPVVDEAGRLTGMITIDDMVDVIQMENREDLLALSGVSEAGANQTVISAVRARAPWLAINLVTAFCASLVVGLFHASIEKIVALAILMPVVAGLCGNAGSQALAVTVRAIADRDLEGPLVLRAIRREALTAICNGLIIASLAAFGSWVWFQDPLLSLVIAAAMAFTFLWAGLVGILAPLVLKTFGADPAVASSVFVLTSIDLMGFFVFLGLASVVLL
jgi:magnesium transporter